MDFQQTTLPESKIDEIAEELFNQVLEKYTASQRIPTTIELGRIAMGKVGIAYVTKCLRWMEELYKDDLIDMGYSITFGE